ncbi:MAG: putative sugar-binding proteinputative S-layer protein [Anaerocolumna sp.]|nr:putative sugar-binding proteinputative S-layer protein [Anaerocolumna sp.]
MFKRIIPKIVSVALCISMLFTTVLHSEMTYAAEGGTNLVIDENQLTGENALDLSVIGNVDWMHLKGDNSPAILQITKQTTTPSAISFNVLENTGTEGKANKGGDSNYLSYSWNDGMEGYETGSNDTGFGVFFPKDERGPGLCSGNVGWNFTVAEQAEETTVVFGLGLWQAVVDVKFYINGEDTPVDTKTIQANDTSQVYKYQVTVPANTVLKVEGIQTETLGQWGNFSLSGIAVGSEGLPEDDEGVIIKQSPLLGEYALDLSKVGNVDWMHLKGENSPVILQIKKQTTGSSAISFDVLQNTDTEGKANRGGDSNYMSYTWNDGMEGYETGTNDTGFGVFLPHNRDAGPCSADVGWKFTVAEQAEETTVVFGLGLWQAVVDVKFYINDEDTPVDTKTIQANGTAQVYKYQVTVPANTILEVKATQTQTLSRDGNSSFSGLAVSSKEVVDKIPLQTRYNEFQDITQSAFTEDTWKAFEEAKVAAKTILDKVDATQAEVDLAKANLEQAQSALVKKDTNVMIDYTGKVKSSYGLGGATDERDRYQTFTADESFKMGYVQVGLIKSSDNGSDLVVKLYATDSNGLPTGSILAQTTVRREEVMNDGLTTAKLSYDLVAGTRYAIAVTQTNLNHGIYTWTVMAKNYFTQNEFFGKSVSGNFVSEAHLGTGLLRIIKELSVDRSTLEALVTEASGYNQKVYTAESWVVLANALESAKKCLNNFDASIEEVTAATSQLEAAKVALVFNVDIKEFDSIVAALDSAIIKGYTDSSVDTFNLAVETAKELDSNAPDEVKLNAYVAILNAISNLKESGQYTSETDRKLTGSFGFEGDMNAPIAFIDGSFKLVSRGGLMIRFGVTGLKAKGISIDWYNRGGYLPCYVSEYTVDNVDYKIEEFANKHMIDGNPVEVAYVKMTAINKSGEVRLLPVVSKELLPINEAAASALIIKDREEVIREYAIKADRFGNEGHTGENYNVDPKVAFPSDEKILEAARSVADIGRESVFENNYADMRAYWDNRLADIVDIELPSSKDANNEDSLVNAYKAGYIYTLIIKDNTFLHVGENGYDRLFSHDTIGILQTLITAGDFKDAKAYLESVPMTGGINIETGLIDPDQYWDANWKLPWAYSVYLSKTGDMDFIEEKFENVIKKMAHSIHDDRTGVAHNGIMKKTWAIDSLGEWTVDNHAALVGLIAYKYICDELAIKESDVDKKDYYLSESQWAKAEYESLLEVVTETLENTIATNNLDYIPASIVEPNSANRCNDIRDANWASMLLFGAFAWDGYLYGADQSEAGANISMIDNTYTYGIARRASLPGASPYNFGGYPHGWYSSAYNAGYGSYALRGESYRDIGIKAYEFAVNSAMSSPFGWWEGVGSTNFPSSPEPTTALWSHDNAAAGEGSCQHMWGQATSSKVLYDSLIAERIYNDNKNVSIIIGRGIPNEWINNATKDNNVVANLKNYPVLQGGRAGYQIQRNGSSLKITLECNKNTSKVDPGTIEQWSIELPMMVNNISASTVGTIDNDRGIVTVPVDTKEVIITLKSLSNDDDSNNVTALTVAGKDGVANITTKGGTLQMVAHYKWLLQ